MFKIKVAENEAVTLPIQRTNYEMVYGVDNILSNMRNVTNINMQLYNNNLQIICKAYKQLQITLSIFVISAVLE